MRKHIIWILALSLLLSIIFPLSPMAQNEYIDILRKGYDAELKPGTEIWESWKQGIASDFGLTLRDIKYVLNLIEQKEDDGKVYLILEITNTGFGITSDGIKKRVIQIQINAYCFEISNKKYLGKLSLNISIPILKNGWNHDI